MTPSRASNSLTPALVRGAIGGMIAGMAMAMFAMVASVTYQHHGFFTPLFHISALVGSPKSMMISMNEAMAGNRFWFAAGPAFVGLMIHMVTGAGYGMVFALVARRLRRGAAGARRHGCSASALSRLEFRRLASPRRSPVPGRPSRTWRGWSDGRPSPSSTSCSDSCSAPSPSVGHPPRVRPTPIPGRDPQCWPHDTTTGTCFRSVAAHGRANGRRRRQSSHRPSRRRLRRRRNRARRTRLLGRSPPGPNPLRTLRHHPRPGP